MIVENLTGWRHPASDDSGNHGGQYVDTAWARVILSEPYLTGGWIVTTDVPGLPWEVVNLEAAPSIVREGDGGAVILSWNGSQSEPRLLAYDMPSGEELGDGFTFGPPPMVTISVTSQTGLHG